jgi:uncharacterized phiE125 gp8 family phage protein
MTKPAMPKPKRISGPASAVLLLDEVKTYMNVDYPDQDAVIAGMIEAATQTLDGYSGTLDGLCLIAQQWEFKARHFCDMVIGLKPLITLDQVSYIDADGASQTLAATEWRALEAVNGIHLVLPDGKGWPSLSAREDAVTVRATFGHASAGQVPESIRQAMLMMVASWFENREAVTAGAVAELPIGARSLLSPYRMRMG